MDTVQHCVSNLSNGALTAKATGTVTVQAAYVEAAPAGTSPAAATVTPQNLSASAQITITAAGNEQRSHDHLEYAGGNLIRHSLEQHAIERHGERSRNFRLHTRGGNRAQSGKADAFRDLHPD